MRRSTTSASGSAGATNDADAAHLKDQSRVSGIGMTSARTRERLVARLREQGITDNEVLERRQYQDRPPRCEYRLTQTGRDLYPVLIAMLTWGDKWMAGESGPPLKLTHECGHAPEAELVCAHCRETLDARQVKAEYVVPRR